MAFQKYRAGNYGRSLMERIAVQFREGKNFALTSASRDALGGPAYVALMHDPETNQIAVQPTDATDVDAIHLSDREMRGYAPRFIKDHRLCKPNQRTVYEATLQRTDEGPILVINLNKPPFLIEEVTQRPEGRKRRSDAGRPNPARSSKVPRQQVTQGLRPKSEAKT